MDAQDQHHEDLDLDHGVGARHLDPDLVLDEHNNIKDESILKTDEDGDCHLQHSENGDVVADENNIDDEDRLNSELDQHYCVDNNPPDSYAVCQAKVADWLDRNTFMERKTSVKFACSKNLDPTQTRTSRRSISLNQKPKLSIIGFRKKPTQQNEGKSKHTEDKPENIRLFRNRSEPGRDYCLLITEPVSPRVSCVGRVGSMRVHGSGKTGIWKSMKTAFSNLVQTNRVRKLVS